MVGLGQQTAVGLQGFAQLPARTSQAALDGAHRNIRHPRYFFVGHTFHIHQHHDQAIISLQGFDAFLQRIAQLEIIDALFGPGGMVEQLSRLPARTRKWLIHINNTNPILDEDSPERAVLNAAGIGVAEDGQQIQL